MPLFRSTQETGLSVPGKHPRRASMRGVGARVFVRKVFEDNRWKFTPYLRIDIVKRQNGGYWLMDVEGIEPFLFLKAGARDPFQGSSQNAGRLADALFAEIKERRKALLRKVADIRPFQERELPASAKGGFAKSLLADRTSTTSFSFEIMLSHKRPLNFKISATTNDGLGYSMSGECLVSFASEIESFCKYHCKSAVDEDLIPYIPAMEKWLLAQPGDLGIIRLSKPRLEGFKLELIRRDPTKREREIVIDFGTGPTIGEAAKALFFW